MQTEEEKRKKKHEWYLKNKEKVKAQAAEYYRRNPEKNREKSRRHYHANKDKELERRKQRRLKNLEAERAYHRDRARRLYIDNRRNLDIYFETHPCVDCGEEDKDVLEFDHVRGEKMFTISTKLRSKRWDQILAEISKCDVRCANCHKRRHARLRKSM